MKILLPNPAKHHANSDITSYLSFYPYYKHLQARVQNPAEQFSDIYRHIVEKLEAFPQLLQPFTKTKFIRNHEEIFQLIASTIIPVSSDKDFQYFALGIPYKFDMLFYSDSFSEYFGSDDNGYITFPPERPFDQIETENLLMAYRLVFRKFFNFELLIPERRINGWIDKVTGLRRYSRIHIDESFIDIKLLGELPSFPEKLINKHTSIVTDLDQLREQFPLALFSFEGFIIRRSIADVTDEECITELKNAMIEMQSENPTMGYDNLRSAVETLIGIVNVEVSLSPFIKLNGKFIFYDKYSGRSILLKRLSSADDREEAYLAIASILTSGKQPLYFYNFGQPTAEIKNCPLAKYFEKSKYCCYLVAPVFYDDELIGMIEIASAEACVLNYQTINKLEPVYPFFKMICVNYRTKFKAQIDSLIREKYTALLPVVEWKFLEQALFYLKEREKKNDCEIGAVSFEHIYPFYGAVDVKDSALKRTLCFQKDIIEQINLTSLTLNVLKEHLQNDFVDTLIEKNNAFRQIAEQGLLGKNEEKITRFLEFEIKSFFEQLPFRSEKIAEAINFYLRSLDPVLGHLNKNRKTFDESIAKLNERIAGFLETEEDKIQQLHPHYFEKCRSDGVEYNIYLGQSLHLNKMFNPAELKKIRLWQLSVMTEITRITHLYEKKLAVPLQTTQLILVYGSPICISFRKDERRFDVEGANGIDFEVLKKRIDKIRIKNSGERLTKPGCIAIVYTHSAEIEEYDDHFYSLRKNNMITGEIEMLELEDVQSISGLKAIRVNVNMEGENNERSTYIKSSFENFSKMKLSGLSG